MQSTKNQNLVKAIPEAAKLPVSRSNNCNFGRLFHVYSHQPLVFQQPVNAQHLNPFLNASP
jgi:hypothetical protein